MLDENEQKEGLEEELEEEERRGGGEAGGVGKCRCSASSCPCKGR